MEAATGFGTAILGTAYFIQKIRYTVPGFSSSSARAASRTSVQAPSSTSDTEKLLDAEEVGTVAGIPASWFLEVARQERIPHIRAGKYVRFRMSDITAALEVRPQKNFA